VPLAPAVARAFVLAFQAESVCGDCCCDECRGVLTWLPIMLAMFDATYDGVQLGLAAQDFLQQFDKFCGTCVLPGNCQLTRLQIELQNFANAAVPHSRFAQWVDKHLKPILANIATAQQQHHTAATRSNAATTIKGQQWSSARADFEQTFCKGTRQELHTLIANTNFGCGLSGIRQLVIRLQALYSMSVVGALPPQQSAVRMVFQAMSMHLFHFNTARKLENALKASSTWTFAKLGEELEALSMEQDDDSAAFMSSAHPTQLSFAPAMTPLPVASYWETNCMSFVPVAPCGIDAVKYAKGLSIMCPNSLCTIHGMMHTWGKCPLAQDESPETVEEKPAPQPTEAHAFVSDCDVETESPSVMAFHTHSEALAARVAAFELTLSQFVSLSLL